MKRKHVSKITVVQKAANGVVKGGILHAERMPFTMQKAAYCMVTGNHLADSTLAKCQKTVAYWRICGFRPYNADTSVIHQ